MWLSLGAVQRLQTGSGFKAIDDWNRVVGAKEQRYNLQHISTPIWVFLYRRVPFRVFLIRKGAVVQWGPKKEPYIRELPILLSSFMS